MKRHIAEELPERKHRQAAAGQPSKDGGDEKKGGKTPEERIRQAVYDIRYRARREEIPLTQAFSQYMQNSNMSQVEKTAVRKKLAGKDGAMKEDYQIEDLASTTVAKALFKVFVEGVDKKEEVKPEQEKIITAEELYFEGVGRTQDRKYKVRVTGTDGRSYVRYATREKINQLRANPNIKEVEMTQYGEPYEGEKKRGEQTARAKAGKGLDPVGREDKDIDNDGDHDKTDRYLLNRRKKIGNAIATRNEEFLGEVKKKSDDGKIDVMPKNAVNPVTVNPPESKGNLMAHTEVEGELITEKAVSTAQQKFMGMVLAAKRGAKPMSPEVAKAASGMTEKEAKKFAKTKHKGLPVHKEECGCDDEEPKLKKSEGEVTDPRGIPTKVNLMKNKLRAMGLKMSYEPEGENIDENASRYLRSKAIQSGAVTTKIPVETGAQLRAKVQAAKARSAAASPAAKPAAPATSTAAPAQKPISGAEALRRRMQLGGASSLTQSYNLEGEVISERGDEPGEGPRQRYGDMRGWDRSGPPTSFGGKWQSKERKAAGAAALRAATSLIKPAD